MNRQRIVSQGYMVAIMGAIFVLIVGILDAIIGVPILIDLLMHSLGFQLGLIVFFWVIAYLVINFLYTKD